MSILGFTIKSAGSGEEFMPIIKFDARAGRMFRVDRFQDSEGWTNENVDITQNFKAVADFENIETGWLEFKPGAPPSMVMVRIAAISPSNPRPPQPTPSHKDGVRFVMKLSKQCAGDKPVREIAGNSKAFLAAIEIVYAEYLRDRERNAGKLPVLVMDGSTPVKSGSGAQTSTNYQPNFRIDGWANRPADLPIKVDAPRAPSEPLPPVQPTLPPQRPVTGSTRAEPPQRKQPVMPAVVDEDEEDFG